MSKARILVVEDEALVAADLTDRLQSLGYEVVGVLGHGEEVEERGRALAPDLVLMDIVLKGEMDGVEAAQRLREKGEMPVVFLTAHADEGTLRRVKGTAPFGYIVKPFEDRELETTIEIALYRFDMETRLAKLERWLSTTLRSIGDAVVATDDNGIVTFINPMAERLTGWGKGEAIGKGLKSVFCLAPDADGREEDLLGRLRREGESFEGADDARLVAHQGARIPISYNLAPIRNEKGAITGAVLVFRDITLRKQAEGERERLIEELQVALHKVKTLSGLLPICAECKKIRDDTGYWQQVDSYIADHSEVRFSHSFCPDCMRKLYPDIAGDVIREISRSQNKKNKS